MVTMSTIGRYIWKLRQDRGGKGYWGLLAVSERVKISHPYLSQLENGKANRPSPEVLRKIADVFGVPVSDLMVQAGYMDAEFPKKKTILVPIKNLYPCISSSQ